MKKYKLIIFDLIDTLANSDGIVKATELLEKDLGKESIKLLIDDGQIDKEPTVNSVICKFKKKRSITNEQEKLVRQWVEWSDISLYEDAIQVLKYLKSKGYRIAIISNSPPTSKDTINDLGIKNMIDNSFFSFETGYRKPEKEIFEFVLNKIGVDPKDAVMIGDSMKNDIFGAQSANIDAILLNRKNNIDFKPKITSLTDLMVIL